MRNIICNTIIVLLLGSYVAYGNPIPTYDHLNFSGGRLQFCPLGAVDELVYGLDSTENFYLRVLRFHGTVIAVLKNSKEGGKMIEVWISTERGKSPNEYFTAEAIKKKLPGGPCDLISFHLDQ